MRRYQALCSMIIATVLGACATQLDESGEPSELGPGPEATSGAGGSGGSSGKGGSTSMAFGGAASVGGTGGAAGSSGGGGGGGTSPTAGASGSGSDDGGSGGEAGVDSSAGGAPATTSCEGLPVWIASAEPPNKPMVQGDELTYMGRKFAVEPEGAMIIWWNDVCPPSGTRQPWCDDEQRYTDLGPCE